MEAPKATTPRKSRRARKACSEWVRVGVREAGPGICLTSLSCICLLPTDSITLSFSLSSKRMGREKGQGKSRQQPHILALWLAGVWAQGAS